ncbi:transposase family protein [Streptomyces sp. L500]|uniref:transposase family protein n=1 Tax=Streptomyces abikoensis TaxID=97398 RepID=UPI00368A46BD
MCCAISYSACYSLTCPRWPSTASTSDGIRVVGSGLRIADSCAAPTACCPDCGAESHRVHDRYRRRLADVVADGQPVPIFLTVRRFRCDSTGCSRRTFAEQAEGLTFRYGRRSCAAAGVPHPHRRAGRLRAHRRQGDPAGPPRHHPDRPADTQAHQ